MATDETSSSPWAVDPAVLSALRLGKAVELFQEGSLDLALVEVEELLDLEPDHLQALDLVGEICWQAGDMATALEAWSRRAELEPEDASGWSKLAASRYEMVRFDEAEAAAREALRLDVGLARAWYVSGLILERRRDPEAERCLRRAHTLEPANYPSPSRLPAPATWDRAFKQALRALAPPLRSFLQGVPVSWADFPEEAELCEVEPPISPHADALFRGSPPELVEGGAPWSQRPSSIRLFRLNLARPTSDLSALADRIADALENEAEAWLGGNDGSGYEAGAEPEDESGAG